MFTLDLELDHLTFGKSDCDVDTLGLIQKIKRYFGSRPLSFRNISFKTAYWEPSGKTSYF